MEHLMRQYFWLLGHGINCRMVCSSRPVGTKSALVSHHRHFRRLYYLLGIFTRCGPAVGTRRNIGHRVLCLRLGSALFAGRVSGPRYRSLSAELTVRLATVPRPSVSLQLWHS